MHSVLFYPDILIRLGAAVLFGGAIGLEREFHGRPAGIRTHILVCLGATMIMLLPQLFLSHNSFSEARIVSDPGRIIAGLVTGIGFLGAGAIIRIGDMVRGLTTAAGIWFTAALGAVIGSGYIVLALVCTGAGMFITIFFDKIEERIPDTQYREFVLTLSRLSLETSENELERIFSDFEMDVLDKYYKWEREADKVTVRFMIKTKNVANGRDVISAISGKEGVSTAVWQKSV
ncbi:MgtC/SapB family protein [bacterium]|nr:MgtC/SapB family protein [bacterium]